MFRLNSLNLKLFKTCHERPFLKQITMLPYTIDDTIDNSLTSTVEVTIDFGNAQKRWCFFITLNQLATNGGFVDGTNIRMHLGVSHMIIVSELNETVIKNVLEQLFEEGRLTEHTTPLL
jgi:hypothetical protein